MRVKVFSRYNLIFILNELVRLLKNVGVISSSLKHLLTYLLNWP